MAWRPQVVGVANPSDLQPSPRRHRGSAFTPGGREGALGVKAVAPALEPSHQIPGCLLDGPLQPYRRAGGPAPGSVPATDLSDMHAGGGHPRTRASCQEAKGIGPGRKSALGIPLGSLGITLGRRARGVVATCSLDSLREGKRDSRRGKGRRRGW